MEGWGLKNGGGIASTGQNHPAPTINQTSPISPISPLLITNQFDRQPDAIDNFSDSRAEFDNIYNCIYNDFAREREKFLSEEWKNYSRDTGKYLAKEF